MEKFQDSCKELQLKVKNCLFCPICFPSLSISLCLSYVHTHIYLYLFFGTTWEWFGDALHSFREHPHLWLPVWQSHPNLIPEGSGQPLPHLTGWSVFCGFYSQSMRVLEATLDDHHSTHSFSSLPASHISNPLTFFCFIVRTLPQPAARLPSLPLDSEARGTLSAQETILTSSAMDLFFCVSWWNHFSLWT